MRIYAITVLVALTLPASAQQRDPSMHQPPTDVTPNRHASINSINDVRQAVRVPRIIMDRILTDMRGYLQGLQEIQMALSRQEYDRAADLAENHVGMSVLVLHRSHEVAKYVPKSFQEFGVAMHRAASRLAIAVGDVAVTGNVNPALASFSEVMGACVACHAVYRLQSE